MTPLSINGEESYFRLQPKVVPKYNYWLVHGSTRRNPATKVLELERIGPYIPPIFFPIGGGILISATVKSVLAESQLTGLKFKPVIKKRIIHHQWRVGDPWIVREYEPEEIINLPTHLEETARLENLMTLTHSPATSTAIGELWEFCPQESHAQEKWNTNGQTYLTGISDKHWDVFQIQGSETIFISARAKEVLNKTLNNWLNFVPISCTHPTAT